MAAAEPAPLQAQAEETKPQLARGILSMRNCLALSAAVMAPVLAVILNAPAAGADAGAALPVAFLLAFVAALFVGNTVIEFAKKLPTAGSFYTFCSRALGSLAGFFTGWLYAGAFVLLTVGLFTANGAFMTSYLQSTFHWNVYWWIPGIILLSIAMTFSVRSIRTSVRLDLILLGLEMFIFALLALIAIIRAGHGNSLSYFNPSSGPTGFSGVGLAVVFGLLSFIGFEAAAVLGEETGNPKRNVPIAVRGALLGVGVFFVFVLYGLAAGFHLNTAAGLKSFLASPAQFSTLAGQYASWLRQPVDLAAIAGLFSCMLAVLNTTVRVTFAMARERVLPVQLSRVHGRFKSPFVSIYALVGFAVVVGILLSVWLGDSLTSVYGYTGAIGTIAIILVYGLANIGLIRFYWGTPEFNVWRHLVAPLIGTAVLLYPLYETAKPGQPFPYNWVAVVVLAWVIIGFGVFAYLRARSPEKLAALGATMATDEIDFAEAHLPSLSSGTAAELAEPDAS
ncbi:MAG TPA: APC family permease [Streptosporangiaceae bacterium]|nr:APC family permease [Streptosporangiaceae bacterium]